MAVAEPDRRSKRTGIARRWDVVRWARRVGPSTVMAYVAIVVLPIVVLTPWLEQWDTFGFHDWDVQTSHRHLVRVSLLEHGQLPYWNPYACGGFPAWGYIEGATTLVSPFLPLYLALDMPVALRLEVLLMALVGAAGAWALAGRFAREPAARLLVVVLWAVNGRWALQAASGHTWHLAYALLPWAWALFDRACERNRMPVHVIATAGVLAMLVYSGGIYPLPHTVLILVVFAVGRAILDRSMRPLTTLAACGVLGMLLAAPKLVPMLYVFDRAPRLVESREWLTVGSLWTLLTSPDQGFYDRPAPVRPYGWHEWGMYISTAGAMTVGLATLLVSGRRAALLKLMGVGLAVLGLGAFFPHAPWVLLHEHIPFFRSQHVPSRFLYPAVLTLSLVAAMGIDRILKKHSVRFPFAATLATALVAGVGLDVALVAQKPMRQSMWMVAPEIPTDRVFHHEQQPPFHYRKRDWAGPMYLSMLANTGVINCYGAPPFEGRGALAVDHPEYRGEVELITAKGGASAANAERRSFSPNVVVVDVEATAEPATLILNMNAAPGWTAEVNGVDVAVTAHRDRVAVALPSSNGPQKVELRYRPPGLGAGALLGIIGVLGCAAWLRRSRARRAGKGDNDG